MTPDRMPCPDCMHRHGCKMRECRHDPCRCRSTCEPCRASIRQAVARTLDWKLAHGQARQESLT